MSTAEKAEDNDWDLQSLCQDFLFESHVPALEKIIKEHYGKDTKKFITEYLDPVLSLLRDVRQSAEECFTATEGPDDNWIPYYEKFVQSVIHVSKLSNTLHKGDFYIHLSSIVPGQLIIKYYDTKQVQSLPLDKSDLPKIWSKDWTEQLRNEMNGRFLFLNCIVMSKTKRLERRPWRYLMSATRNVSFKKYRAIEKADNLEESCKISRQSLFLEKPLNIFEINFELLHTGVACLPGTKDLQNGPILLINPSRPDWNNIQYSTVELTRLLMYFHTLPKKQEPYKGFSVILDSRKTSTKRRLLEDIIEAMICFQESCPGAIHIVYVVAKKDSPILMFNTTKIKEQLNFEFKIITTVQDLKKYIDESQLTPEFNGTFHYDHDEWIRFRIKLEPFMTGCRSAAKLAMEVMHQFTSTKVGENLQECKTLLEQHEQKVKEVFLDSRLSALQVEGEQLLIRLEEEKSNLNKTEDYKETVQCVSRLYNQMNEVFCKLEMLTDNRTKRLKQCLQLRDFETESDKVTTWIKNEAEPFLDKEADLGDSLRHVETLQEELKTFDNSAKQYYDKIENLLEEGRSLYQGGHFESIGLQESCKYLEDMYKRISEKHEDRRKLLILGREFHQLLNEISEWTISTLKQIALMKMEEILTLDGVLALTKSLEDYLEKHPVWPASRLHRISEIATNIGQSNMVSQAEGVLTRYKEVEDMLGQRKETLGRAEEKLKGHPSCEISSTNTGGSDESSSTPQDGDEESDAAPEDTDDEIDSPIPEAVQAFISPERKISSEKLYTWKEVSGLQPDSPPPLESIEECEQNLSPRIKEKLKYIVQEMIDTERDYVRSLEYIMQNYLSRMEDPNLLPSLKGKKNILFGNIERIYDFHNRCFLHELEISQDRPLQIGSCFLKWERQFYLYALYNKNKPRSDQLLSDHGNVYFRACQKELGDKLDLGSYLMKPVQRMCKYGLLLRDMIDTCKDGSRVNELKEAENMVRFQLRHGNDLLAMDSLRNCDVNVKEQGRLLRQDNFIVWSGKKKHHRRVFLFEDLVLFSKAKRQQGGVDLFCYKNSLKTADLGLTESVGDGGHKFELWFRKRKTGEKFILQASNMKVKTAWLTEITKILWKQAVRNKEYGLTEASTGISVESQPALHIPSTRYDEPLPYQPTITTSVVLRASSSPTTNLTDKRISLIGSELSDSSASSGFCDANSHLTEDDGASSRGAVASTDNRVTHPKQQVSPRGHRRKKSAEEPSNKIIKEINKSQADKSNKTSKSPTPEEEKKSTNFFRNFALPLRDRSNSDKTSELASIPGEECVAGGVVLRRNSKDYSNKRRSFIDRITHKNDTKEKDKQRRRSLGETTISMVDTRTDAKESSRGQKSITKSKSTCLATEVCRKLCDVHMALAPSSQLFLSPALILTKKKTRNTYYRSMGTSRTHLLWKQ